ncbi:MAG: hypothetical protein M1822_007162 [Bathelium mastoideum]|nr:MAG: hypothetical protein M1822_007162 [Bathelium mastoideum]
MPVLPRIFKRSATITTPPPRTTTLDETGLLKSQPQYNQLDEASLQGSTEKPTMIHSRATQPTATDVTASSFSDTLEPQVPHDDDIERILAVPIHAGEAALSRPAGIVRTVSIAQTEGKLF